MLRNLPKICETVLSKTGRNFTKIAIFGKIRTQKFGIVPKCCEILLIVSLGYIVLYSIGKPVHLNTIKDKLFQVNYICREQSYNSCNSS